MNGATYTQAVGLRLVWAALTMPDGVLEWTQSEAEFRLTDAALAHVHAKMQARKETENESGVEP